MVSVATQLEKFESICRKLIDAAETISDAAIMSKLLSSLPSRFSAFRMAWECTAKAEQRKDNLIAKIIRENKRLNTAEEEALSLALQVKGMQLKHKKQLKTDNCKQGKKKKTIVKKIRNLRRISVQSLS